MTIAEKGHNRPPLYDPDIFNNLQKKVNDFADAAGGWKDCAKITTQDQAEKINDYLAGARKLAQKIESQRKQDKEPHLEAGRQVDRVYKDLTDIVTRSKNLVGPLLQKFLQEKEAAARREREAEQQRLRAEAEKAEAERLAATHRNDVIGVKSAEDEAKGIQKEMECLEKKNSVKVTSATGGAKAVSLRTVRRAEIININQAMLYYREHPDMKALLLKLANADIRASKGQVDLPGFQIFTEKVL